MTNVSTTMRFQQEDSKTRELFAAVEWSNGAQAVANVFCAFPYMTFTKEKLEASVSALFNLEIDLGPTICDLLRRKVLRSRRVSGNTLYEVNY